MTARTEFQTSMADGAPMRPFRPPTDEYGGETVTLYLTPFQQLSRCGFPPTRDA
jgi:hypothetical protein